MEYLDDNLPAPAHLEGVEYHGGTLTPHGFPDAVVFANDGNPLEGTYETRRYVPEDHTSERTCHVVIEDECEVCSVCGEDIDSSWAACPNCGAKVVRE